MTTFWERAAAHSANHYDCFVLCLFVRVSLVVSHFGIEDWTLVLIVPVPGKCLPLTFH